MPSFWKKIRQAQPGPNALGVVTYVDNLLRVPQSQGAPYGLIRVLARPNGGGAGGYGLSITQDYGPDVAEVYFLPWENYRATVALRAAYENFGREIFFMTSTLTGCRFSISPDLVVHTAFLSAPSSAGRSLVEEAETGPRAPGTRRMSVSASPIHNDSQYGVGYNAVRGYPNTYVFGMRMQGNFVYKRLQALPLPGSWEFI
jgi:hypothetical protein